MSEVHCGDTNEYNVFIACI